MSKFAKLATAGIMALTLAGMQARADGPTPAPKTDKPAAVAAPLTDESLLTMLQNMGYDPKVEKLEKTSIYTVKVDQGDWTYYIDVSLSNDKDELWITSSVADMPADGQLPAAMLQKLLEKNNDIGPSAVYLDAKFKKVKVGLPLLNHGGITPQVFRTYFGDYMKDVTDVQKVCVFPKADDKTDAKK
ncbi:MAG TPA: hypothetical protein VMS17_20560 [Gemmataceae bacterium]|nr:hypothetical protein [Gemmataceae bacterium]